MYRFALTVIKYTEFLDPVSTIQYLPSLRVFLYLYQLPTKPCSKPNGVLTIALIANGDYSTSSQA